MRRDTEEDDDGLARGLVEVEPRQRLAAQAATRGDVRGGRPRDGARLGRLDLQARVAVHAPLVAKQQTRRRGTVRGTELANRFVHLRLGDVRLRCRLGCRLRPHQQPGGQVAGTLAIERKPRHSAVGIARVRILQESGERCLIEAFRQRVQGMTGRIGGRVLVVGRQVAGRAAEAEEDLAPQAEVAGSLGRRFGGRRAEEFGDERTLGRAAAVGGEQHRHARVRADTFAGSASHAWSQSRETRRPMSPSEGPGGMRLHAGKRRLMTVGTAEAKHGVAASLALLVQLRGEGDFLAGMLQHLRGHRLRPKRRTFPP